MRYLQERCILDQGWKAQSSLLISFRSRWILLLIADSSPFSRLSAFAGNSIAFAGSFRSQRLSSPREKEAAKRSVSLRRCVGLRKESERELSSVGRQEIELLLLISIVRLGQFGRQRLKTGVLSSRVERQQGAMSSFSASAAGERSKSVLALGSTLGEQKLLLLPRLRSASHCFSTSFHSFTSSSYMRLTSDSRAASSLSLAAVRSSPSLSLSSEPRAASLLLASSSFSPCASLADRSSISCWTACEKILTLRSTSMSMPAICCSRSKMVSCSSSASRLHFSCAWSCSSMPKVCSLLSLTDWNSPAKKEGERSSGVEQSVLQLTVLCSFFYSNYCRSQKFRIVSFCWLTRRSSSWLREESFRDAYPHRRYCSDCSCVCRWLFPYCSASRVRSTRTSSRSPRTSSLRPRTSSCSFLFLPCSWAISSQRYCSFFSSSSPERSVCVSASTLGGRLRLRVGLEGSSYPEWQNLASRSIWKSALALRGGALPILGASRYWFSRRGQSSWFHLSRMCWMSQPLRELYLASLGVEGSSSKRKGCSMQLLLGRSGRAGRRGSVRSMQVFLLLRLGVSLKPELSMSQGVELLMLSFTHNGFSATRLITYFTSWLLSSPPSFLLSASLLLRGSSHQGVFSGCVSLANSMCSRMTDSLSPTSEQTSAPSSTTMISWSSRRWLRTERWGGVICLSSSSCILARQLAISLWSGSSRSLSKFDRSSTFDRSWIASSTSAVSSRSWLEKMSKLLLICGGCRKRLLPPRAYRLDRPTPLDIEQQIYRSQPERFEVAEGRGGALGRKRRRVEVKRETRNKQSTRNGHIISPSNSSFHQTEACRL